MFENLPRLPREQPLPTPWASKSCVYLFNYTMTVSNINNDVWVTQTPLNVQRYNARRRSESANYHAVSVATDFQAVHQTAAGSDDVYCR